MLEILFSALLGLLSGFGVVEVPSFDNSLKSTDTVAPATLGAEPIEVPANNAGGFPIVSG